MRKQVLDTLTKVGRIYTVVLRVLDQEKAMELLDTMYAVSNGPGVQVVAWGEGNEVRHLQRKLDAIAEEQARHEAAITEIMNRTRTGAKG